MVPADFARLVRAELHRIIENATAAYLPRAPKELARLPAPDAERRLGQPRETADAFVNYFVTGTLDQSQWRATRDSTIDAAAVNLPMQHILDMINAVRATGVDALRTIAQRHPQLSDSVRERLAEAIETYLAEIAEQEDRLRGFLPPSRLDAILADLEAEGADLA